MLFLVPNSQNVYDTVSQIIPHATLMSGEAQANVLREKSSVFQIFLGNTALCRLLLAILRVHYRIKKGLRGLGM